MTETVGATSPTLEKSCLEAIGEELLVEPFHGWGWAERQPALFHIVLRALERRDGGELTGGFGQVTDSRHELAGHFIVFKLHYVGLYNFTSAIGDYVVYIYPSLPESWRDIVAKLKASEVPRGYACAGYARIGIAQDDGSLPKREK